MGEVYRAHDTRLGRDVAIKVVPESFASDPERLARFEREAQLLASLNHPNIAIIHGLEESTGIRALVMELVEGPTLAERLTQGSGLKAQGLPLDEALPIARQIADALEAAHERGIIHRDLKPANMKLTPSGKVKVLDLGLAKRAEAGGAGMASGAGGVGGGALSLSPTLSVQATMAGVILGTAAYMSPEQARGKPVDRRADIWAFGCVLFEMLTGKQAFDAGETVSDAVAAILKNEPDWTALPAETPPNIRTLLRRCLQKDPQKRLPHIGIARIEIDESLGPEAAIPSSGTRDGSGAAADAQWRKRVWLAAGVVTVVVLALAVPALRHLSETPPPTMPETRTDIVTPAGDVASFALSPDGQQLVYSTFADGVSQLWVRPLRSRTAAPLAGTEGATFPFWSPDSRSLGFFAGGMLKRIEIEGGSPQTLANVTSPRGGTWNANGVILFTPTTIGGVFRVSASGGDHPVPVTSPGGGSDRFPHFLPDGRHFLYYRAGTTSDAGIYLGSIDSADAARLGAADSGAVSTAGDWVLFVRGGALVGQRVDLQQRLLLGNPVTVADHLALGFGGAAALSASATGLIAYRSAATGHRQLKWFDRTGGASAAFAPPDDAMPSSPRLSPDGQRVAVHRTLQGNTDIWLLDGTRTSRFTFDAAPDEFALWSPDGRQVVFDSARNGGSRLYTKPSNGVGREELLDEGPLHETTGSKTAYSWSLNGQFVLFRMTNSQSSADLWVLPLQGDRKPWPFAQTKFTETAGQFSPDGRWVAYMSNESGRYEVYVRPFDTPSAAVQNRSATEPGQRQVSTDGGIYPCWRADGKEIFYIRPDGWMMAAPILAASATLSVGTPAALFQTQILGGGIETNQGRQFDVTRDGRFLINTVLEETAVPITILQNWKPPQN